jgi:hypothetical protein
MELSQQEGEELLKNWPNQREHHAMQELLHEQDGQSMLMN